jgi:hypothetical protein
LPLWIVEWEWDLEKMLTYTYMYMHIHWPSAKIGHHENFPLYGIFPPGTPDFSTFATLKSR